MRKSASYPWLDAAVRQESCRDDRLRITAGNQEVAHGQQVADGPAVCDLRVEHEKCDALGSSDRAGGVLYAGFRPKDCSKSLACK